jgi:iron complex outermembrane receptor protein
MSNKPSLLLLAAILCSLCSFAGQTLTSIKGKVKDDNGKALSAATVSLLKIEDSSLVKTEVTDANGAFEFASIAEGNYFIETSSVGYQLKQSAVITVAGEKQMQLPDIQLVASASELSGVTVKAKKPMVEIKADKTVFNVEQSINATGSNALELLSKSPGVQVDNNESISMKGKTGVKVYVDGRMMQLDTKSLAAYLKSINSNDIEAIEMIANPSAKYDASGNAGILNIRLKKNKKYGTNGSVNLGYVQGFNPKGNGSVNLNYRDKKINIFGNLGGSMGQYRNTLDLNRTQNDTTFDQQGVNYSKNKSGNLKAGADYFIDSKNTIGVMANVNYNDENWTSSSNTAIAYAPTKGYVKSLIATNSLPGKRTNANFNMNYRYTDTSGREVNFDADYGLFRGDGRSRQPNSYYSPTGDLLSQFIYQNYMPTDINIYTAKVDVSQKGLGGNIGYGAKFSYVKTENRSDFFNEYNGKPEMDLARSNSFDYTENVNAAYVNYNRQFNDKWSLQAGLRAEQTNSEGKLIRTDGQQQADDNVKRHYFNLFPSGALTFTINPKHTLNLTYSRRIDRPTYQDLNPFEYKLDELTYEKGNAFLRPQYSSNVELGHTFMGKVNTSVGYSHVKDYATKITDTANVNATFLQQQNLATLQIISANISAPFQLTKWWSGYGNVWYNYQLFNGKIGDNNLKRNYSMFGVYLQNSFTIGKKGTTAELSGFFNGPSVWGATWKIKPMGSVDIGLQQPLLNKKASIKISVTDVFFTSYWRSDSDFGGLKLNGQGKQESRTFRLSFTYRFGSNEIKQNRDRKTGLESEKGRIKG